MHVNYDYRKVEYFYDNENEQSWHKTMMTNMGYTAQDIPNYITVYVKEYKKDK